MDLEFSFGGTVYRARMPEVIDCSLPVRNGGTTAWGIPPARIAPYQDDGFVGSIAQGASVNFNDIGFNPHAHGTHTECMGHITALAESVNDTPPPALMPARLVSLSPEGSGPDRYLSRAQFLEILGDPVPPALVIRTAPGEERQEIGSWSGAGAPYLKPEAAAFIARAGVEHLLIDLPSVDPESDGGALAAHKAFWGLPDNPRHSATITELIAVPQAVPDGLYLLNLQMAAFENDACPSRPLLFPLEATGHDS